MASQRRRTPRTAVEAQAAAREAIEDAVEEYAIHPGRRPFDPNPAPSLDEVWAAVDAYVAIAEARAAEKALNDAADALPNTLQVKDDSNTQSKFFGLKSWLEGRATAAATPAVATAARANRT